MKNFKIEDVQLTNIPSLEKQIKETVHSAFKCPGYDEDIIVDLKMRTNPVIKICTHDNGQIIGFGYGYIAQKNTLASFLKAKTENISASLLAADTKEQIGIIKTIVSAPLSQGRGIGTKLVQDIEHGLLQSGATKIIVPAWKAGNRINIHHTLKKTGYTPYLTVDDFWKMDCDSEKFQCVDRVNKCVCSAVFYTKTL